MKATKTIVKEFIKNNGLDFGGSGSDLNGNCVILAGFICYTVGGIRYDEGEAIINTLKLSEEALKELLRVYEYAFNQGYEEFWSSPEAMEKYIF